MNILKSEIFPTTVYECNIFEYSSDAKEIFDETFECIKQETMIKNYFPVYQTKNVHLHRSLKYFKLTNFIQSVLNEIRVNGNYDTEKFSITEMWANRSDQNIVHPNHFHPNSYFSGVFYFTDGSPINFVDPVMSRINSLIFVNNKNNNPYTSRKIFPGLLLIFPSWLHHSTSPNTNVSRWSLSFNCFPMGKTNYGTGSLPLCGINFQDQGI